MGISLIWLMHMGTHDQTKPLNQIVLSISPNVLVKLCKSASAYKVSFLLWGVNSFTCLLYHFFTIYQRKMMLYFHESDFLTPSEYFTILCIFETRL